MVKCGFCKTEVARNYPCQVCRKPMHSDCRVYHMRSHRGVGGGRHI